MAAQLFAAVLETRNYVVGAAAASSGLFRLCEGQWEHLGWANVRCFGLGVPPRAEAAFFLACGNGVLRSRDGGTSWRVTTDWRVTEVLRVVHDPFTPGRLFAATAYGLWASPDEGETWAPASEGIPAPRATFVAALVADAATPGRLLAGTEEGVYLSADAARTWQPAGPRVPLRALAQHPADAAAWLAATDGHGLFASREGGRTWAPVPGLPAGGAFYAVAFAPDGRRCAAAGYRTGLWTSDDGGNAWHRRPLDGAAHSAHALAYDAADEARLWVGTLGDGLYAADGDAAPAPFGLPEATLYDLASLPA